MVEILSQTSQEQVATAPVTVSPLHPSLTILAGIRNASLLLPAFGLVLAFLFGLGVLVTYTSAQAVTAGPLQTLINNALDGGSIIVPAGTYTESLTVNKTLTMTGVSSSTTIIHALTGQRVITVTSGNNLRLVNVTVTGGQTSDVGGGVYVANGSLSLVNCLVISNTAAYGGGIFQGGTTGRVDVIGSVIELNSTSNHGGGLYVNGSAALTNTLVLSNTASWHGGGLHVISGKADLTGGVFSNNRALNGNGGAVSLNGDLTLTGTQIISNTAFNGGGLQQWNAGFTVLISNARFERNAASGIGGGAAISSTIIMNYSSFVSNTVDSGNTNNTFGGGLYAGADVQIFASTFSGNSALCLNGSSCSSADGGGLYAAGTNPALTGVAFRSNRAGRMGGGMYSNLSSLVLLNVTFSGNRAGWGGGFYQMQGSAVLTNVLFSGNEAGWAGGILGDRSILTLTHVTFSGNNGYNVGGALYNYWGTATLVNSILWGDTAFTGPEISTEGSATTTVTYSDIQFAGVYTGAGNINADPRFVLPVAVSAAPTTAGNYHLWTGSPAIDHGTNAGVTIDLDGHPRPVGLGYDMGAYEFRPPVYLPFVLR
jgi:hypothetical protein